MRLTVRGRYASHLVPSREEIAHTLIDVVVDSPERRPMRPIRKLARWSERPPHSENRSCDGYEVDYRIFSQIRSVVSPGTNSPSAPVASSFGSAPPTISRRIFSI